MKRYSVLKFYINNLLTDDDLIIITGPEMCKEAFINDKPNIIYLDDNFGLAVSFAIGIAIATTKRVVVFTGEGDLIRELGAGIQAAASKCRNLHIVILDNEVYGSVGKLPNIFGPMNSKKSMMASFGLYLHDYTPHFRDKKQKTILDFYNDIKGPLAIFISVDPVLKRNLLDIELPKDLLMTRFMAVVKKSAEDNKNFSEVDLPILELNKPVTFGGSD